MMIRFRKFTLLALAAVLLGLPSHNGNLGFLAYIAFLPYFLVIRKLSSSDAFKDSFLFGFFFFCFIGFWLGQVNVLGFILLAAFQAVYFALFGWAASKFLNPLKEFEKVEKNSLILKLRFL